VISAFRALERPAQSVVAAGALLVVAVVASIAGILRASEAGARGMTLDICPSDYGSFPEDAPTLTCGCSAEAVKQGSSVYGANPYYWQSAPCRAALHAGAIGAQGGQRALKAVVLSCCRA